MAALVGGRGGRVIPALILAAALTVQASIEEGKALRIRVEGEALTPDALLTVRISREKALPQSLPWMRLLPVSRIGSAEAAFPMEGFFIPGRYRVEVLLDPGRQLTEKTPPGGFPEPVSVVLEMGTQDKSYLKEVLKAEDLIQGFFEEAGGIADKAGALQELAVDDQPTALSAWKVWRSEARIQSRMQDLWVRSRDLSLEYFPESASRFQMKALQDLCDGEAHEFGHLRMGQPEEGRLSRKGLLEKYLGGFFKESLLYRMSILKDLVKVLEREVQAQDARPDRARWDLRTGRIREALDLWGAAVPPEPPPLPGEPPPKPEDLDKGDLPLPPRPPLYPRRMRALHAAVLAWLAAEEARLFIPENPEGPQTEARKKELSKQFQPLWDHAQ